jgi:hypothetical protein
MRRDIDEARLDIAIKASGGESLAANERRL